MSIGPRGDPDGVHATLSERLARHADRQGRIAALDDGRTTITYDDLHRLVAGAARRLEAAGIVDGATVGLTVRDEIDHLIVALALLDLGAAQVALASHAPAPVRAELARRCGVTHCVVDDPTDRVDAVATVLAGPLALGESEGRPTPGRAGAGDAPALILTGSGTTGRPKIVRYTQRDLARQAGHPVIDPRGERLLHLASVENNNAIRMRLYTLYGGGTCVLRNRSESTAHRLCATLRATWLELSVVHAAALAQASRTEGRLPTQVRVRVGGSRVPASLRRAILERATSRLHVSYGATETAAIAIAAPSMHDVADCVGPPLAGVEVEILGADGAPARPGEPGSIRLRADGMARAYVDDDEATRRHFRDGWFVPGDVGSWTADGRLCVHGRLDDMMILNGINIHPFEIERVLEDHPSVEAAAAFPLASAVHGQIPMAAVELRAGAEVSAAELTAWSRERLGSRAPRRVLFVESLPRNAAGKVLRRELAGAMEGRVDAEAAVRRAAVSR